MRFHRFFLTLALMLAACGKDPSTTAPAARQASATTTSKGPRIISTVPAATLNLVLLGATDRLVGVTKYDRLFLPPGKEELPIVGDYESMDYEQLVRLKPTAIIIQIAESRIAPRLREVAQSHHIELINLRLDHLDDIWGSARALGKAAGREDAAEKAIDNAQQELKDIKALYGKGPKPKVLYLVNPPGLIAGGKTFIEEMITLAGGENAGAKAGNGFLEIGREAMVKLAPDVLLVGAPDQIEEQSNDPRLESWITLPVPAARAKRVYLITDGNSQMASVDIGKNVRILADIIHRGEPALPPPASIPATQKAGAP